jgi:hypothetical protein
VISEPLRINVIAGPLSITTTGELARGTVGVIYSQALQRLGGAQPFTWALDSGALPAGLTIGASTGVISGTPTAAGTFIFTVKVTDDDGTTATSSTLTINIDPALVITTTGDLTAGQVNVDYTFTLQGTGGHAPYTWTLFSGQLPPGLSLNPNTGVISGRPLLQGTYNFTVQLRDSTPTSVLSGSLRIVVAP